MSDAKRYERLVKQFDANLFRDTAIINRVDFDFVLGCYNKYLRAKEEVRQLRLKVQLLEKGERV